MGATFAIRSNAALRVMRAQSILFCYFDPMRDWMRRRLRREHDAYMTEYSRHVFNLERQEGGADGEEHLLILLDLNPVQAELFIKSDPYYRASVYKKVEIFDGYFASLNMNL
jgi:hypothetical protein